MNQKLIIGFDQDQVLADLHTPWLARYNKDYNDKMTPEDITNWNIETLVKEECGTKIFDYIKEPGFYRHLKPIEGSIAVCKRLSANPAYELAVVTATPKMAYMDKYEWLEEHFPFINEDNIMAVRNKGLAGTDFLVDDRIDNLVAFKGAGILFDAPYNRGEKSFVRVKDWVDVDILFSKVLPPIMISLSNDKERLFNYMKNNPSSLKYDISEIRHLRNLDY